MVNKTKVLLILSIFLFSCSTQTEEKIEEVKKEVLELPKPNPNLELLSLGLDTNKFMVANEFVVFPTFSFELDLTEDTKSTLKDNQETIIVDASFFGVPKEPIEGDYDFQASGYYTFKNEIKELETGTYTADFIDVLVELEDLKALKNPNFEVSVNVYTGRKFADNNLLSTEYFQDSIYNILDSTKTIRGKLIYPNK